MSEEITLYETKWLGLYRTGRWDYVRRPNSSACVAVLPITDQQEIILIEQFRIPVANTVIEIPAGLVGDEADFQHESLADSAARELLEETGYLAQSINPILSSPTSAGMTPEITHIFLATQLTRETQGGGVSGEEITVHIIPLSNLRSFLSEKQSQGLLIDFKIHAALAAANISF
jgi:ADP-ribose pyrophosphatase